MEAFSLFELIEFLSLEKLTAAATPATDMRLTGFSSSHNQRANSVCWSRQPQIEVNCDDPFVVIAPPGSAFTTRSKAFILEAEFPRLAFAKALDRFIKRSESRSISPSAQLGKNVTIGQQVSIGHYSVIGDNVSIGSGTIIGHHVVISDGSSIGANCLIKSHAIIGEEGFGFEKDLNGIPFRIPHIGGVRIGNNVEVGSGTTVCRGVLEDTVVGNDCKIDDHVHIAHNIELGKGVMIAACAEVSGSVRIGKGSWLAPNCSIRDRIQIGEGVTVGLGAVVTKELPDGVVAKGNPARFGE